MAHCSQVGKQLLHSCKWCVWEQRASLGHEMHKEKRLPKKKRHTITKENCISSASLIFCKTTKAFLEMTIRSGPGNSAWRFRVSTIFVAYILVTFTINLNCIWGFALFGLHLYFPTPASGFFHNVIWPPARLHPYPYFVVCLLFFVKLFSYHEPFVSTLPVYSLSCTHMSKLW